ncbi:MAG TPA: hypothetical protein VFS42_11090 [Burkholderiaceae bacterium]|nr:hypothetical protein [Burkholderiaceae bacterium]
MFAALAGAAWLAFFGDTTSSPHVVVEAQSHRAASPTIDTRATALQRPTTLEHLVPREKLLPLKATDATARDLFAGRSWAPPPPPPDPVVVEAVAPPAPPPQPFTFIGKKWEANQWEVYLSSNDQVHIVREGATVDQQWRIDRIEPPTLSLTYLPLGQTQTLSIGEAH